MITKLKAARYHTRRVERPTPPPQADTGGQMFDTQDDGFGNMDFRPPAPDDGQAEPASSAVLHRVPRAEAPASDEGELAAIAAEGLTGRQLRRARLIAQKHGLDAKSDTDAVRLLRRAGIEPFTKASLLQVVTTAKETGPDPVPEADASPPPSAGRSLARLPGDSVQLPQRPKPIAVPSTEQRANVNQAAEILRMQQEIARRRRRRLALLFGRLFAFVFLPTFLAGWYFYVVATPIYSVRSEFIINKAGPASSGGSLGGLFSGTAFATTPDSIAVQGYLQSPEAMGRLDADLGFRNHFQSAEFDTLQRLAPDATLSNAYKAYKKFVKISFDSTEGVIRMEVMAADPKIAARWSEQLIKYAEERVDHMTQRLREDQMKDAKIGYEEAEAALVESQHNLVKLQEKFQILSSETEVGLVVAQISALESQVTQEKLALAQMEANPDPNQARMEPIKRRIATLEEEVATLRARLTEDSTGETSLAQIQGELLIAQSDMTTRQMMLAQALQSMETARVEANRQVRYLSLSVSPTAPDEPSYPRAFENTLVTMLILLGIYLMVSMTAAILREQVSS